MTDMLNNSVIKEVRVARVSDDIGAIRVKYSPRTRAEEVPSAAGLQKNSYHKLYVDPDGDTDSTNVCLFINIGESASSYTQYQFSSAASAATDPLGVDASPTHVQCTTVKAMVDAINAVTDGVFEAHVLHAPCNHSTAQATFIETGTGPGTEAQWLDLQPNYFSEIMAIDQAADETAYLRIGVPEEMDAGRMKVLGLEGKIAGASSGDVKLARDDEAASGGGANAPVELFVATAAAAQTSYISDDMGDAATYRGPLLVMIEPDAITTSPDIRVRYVSAEW